MDVSLSSVERSNMNYTENCISRFLYIPIPAFLVYRTLSPKHSTAYLHRLRSNSSRVMRKQLLMSITTCRLDCAPPSLPCLRHVCKSSSCSNPYVPSTPEWSGYHNQTQASSSQMSVSTCAG